MTIRQYKPFPGWGGIIDRLQSENFDVTEADMIEYWHYMWRKSNEITMPDYDADITIGGPIPGIQPAFGRSSLPCFLSRFPDCLFVSTGS